ncbi:MAG: phosphomethylpyrimidine synthase ThiC [Candidatus Omnitrophica bacterium]|nr:phosphomethylpyrimidine synthase ThiC [Candidatus Omnitrophota bacterium]
MGKIPTQLELASKGIITDLMKRISKEENVDAKLICKRIKEGRVVIINNNRRKIEKPCAVGYGLRTKVNVNIGTSTDNTDIKDELKKLKVALEYGADTVMDLSVGGDLKKIRKIILKESPLPVGTVPIYEVAVGATKKYGSFIKMKKDDIFDVLKDQAEDGVDFFTIHAGITYKSLELLKKYKRLLDIVSRGGAILASWMIHNKRENPLYEYFDRVLDIAYRYDITLSLGDALRPGSIIDATDNVQIEELKNLGELALRARKKNVSVIIEGPGHVPLSQIKKNVALEKKICRGAPFYVLGPLITDIALGYDHISAAIGGALAAAEGADFLCYVTPSEHIRHPTVEDVKEGLIATRIAAHAADLAKGIKEAFNWDKKLSFYRKNRNWKKQINLSIDPKKASIMRKYSKPSISDVCTMCGKYCSIKLAQRCLAL